jgi:hypothetical protein
LITGVLSVFGGVVGYLTLIFELHAAREVALDSASLHTIGTMVGLWLAHRKFVRRIGDFDR